MLLSALQAMHYNSRALLNLEYLADRLFDIANVFTDVHSIIKSSLHDTVSVKTFGQVSQTELVRAPSALLQYKVVDITVGSYAQTFANISSPFMLKILIFKKTTLSFSIRPYFFLVSSRCMQACILFLTLHGTHMTLYPIQSTEKHTACLPASIGTC